MAALGADPALVSVVFVTFTLYRAPLTLIFTADEEIGCLGAQRLTADLIGAPRYAIVASSLLAAVVTPSIDPITMIV